MNKLIVFCVIILSINHLYGQVSSEVLINKSYPDIEFSTESELQVSLQKGEIYDFAVLQQGIDVELFLLDNNKKEILRQDTPNGQNGMEKFTYSPTETNRFYLKIKRLEEAGNSESGQIRIHIKKLSEDEKKYREAIIKELESENKKTVQTIDIDHFWEAFDELKNCKTHQDSVNAFQRLYLDRATDGLKDFMELRDFTAEAFVEVVAIVPKFYNSVRENTYEIKKAVPIVNEIVENFKAIYPNFQSHKVTFAIGLLNTGGTVSDDFLLIGTEIVTVTKNTDLSEIPSEAFKEQLASSDDIVQRIKNFVAHEYVHTQQTPAAYAQNAIRCPLLDRAMREGFCDFIGELLSGSQINIVALEYGNQHEEELWQEFKNELCSNNADGWLYNYSTVKEKPADLGYYIGYKIAQAYYNNNEDKEQAIIDIIEMDDPVSFLQKSGYDRQKKNTLAKKK